MGNGGFGSGAEQHQKEKSIPASPWQDYMCLWAGEALGVMGDCEQTGFCLPLRVAPPPLLAGTQCWSRAHYLCSGSGWDVQVWPFPSTG